MLMGITGRRDAEDDGADRRDGEGGDAVVARGAVETDGPKVEAGGSSLLQLTTIKATKPPLL